MVSPRRLFRSRKGGVALGTGIQALGIIQVLVVELHPASRAVLIVAALKPLPHLVVTLGNVFAHRALGTVGTR